MDFIIEIIKTEQIKFDYSYNQIDYFVGEMFNHDNNFYHHYHGNGKPNIFLTDKDNQIINIDADLFFPLKKGMVIANYENGEMVTYSYLVERNNEIIEVKKLPYGVLKGVKNAFNCPNNIFKLALEKYFNKGTKTWFFWKSLINSRALNLNKDYLFDTLTAKQERIPNLGMIIYSGES